MSGCAHDYRLLKCEQIESGQLRSLYQCTHCKRWRSMRPHLAGPQSLREHESTPPPIQPKLGDHWR